MKNAWLEHLKKTRHEHPEMSMKEAMIYAKKTYKNDDYYSKENVKTFPSMKKRRQGWI